MSKLRINKSDFFIFLLYFYVFRNLIRSFFPFFQYSDEIFAVIIVFYINYKELFYQETKVATFSIIGFILVGIISYIINRFQPFFTVTIIDLFLDIKFWIWLYFGYKFTDKRADYILSKMDVHVKLLITFLFAISLIDVFFHVFNELNDIKMGMRSVGLWDGPASLSSTMVSLLVIVMANKNNHFLNFYTLFSLIVIALTLRYKSLATIAVFFSFIFFNAINLKKIKIYHILFISIIAILVSKEQIVTYIYTRDVNARSVLWIESFTLASIFFPFGAGPGTFASYLSGVFYSPLYQFLGIQDIQGLTQASPSFVSDTFWPAVIGQFGFAGLFLYLLLLYWLFNAIKKNANMFSNYYFTGMFILCYLMITSVAESSFLHWNAFFLAITLGLIVRSKKRSF